MSSLRRAADGRIASAARLFLVLSDTVNLGDPRTRGTKPVLPPRDELIALAQNADTHRVRWLHAITGRRRIDRRAAFRTERLPARITAFRGRLHVDGRLARHFERRAG